MTYDVVIYSLDTGKVTEIVGQGLKYSTSPRCAVAVLGKALVKVNNNASLYAAIVDTESVAVGDVVTEDVIR